MINSLFKNTKITSLDSDHQFAVGKETGNIFNITYSALLSLLSNINWNFKGSLVCDNPVSVGENSAPEHAVRQAYVDYLDHENIKKTGNQEMNGEKTFNDYTKFLETINIKSSTIPGSSGDPIGNDGDIAVGSNYIYFKSKGSGWLRVEAKTF